MRQRLDNVRDEQLERETLDRTSFGVQMEGNSWNMVKTTPGWTRMGSVCRPVGLRFSGLRKVPSPLRLAGNTDLLLVTVQQTGKMGARS